MNFFIEINKENIKAKDLLLILKRFICRILTFEIYEKRPLVENYLRQEDYWNLSFLQSSEEEL